MSKRYHSQSNMSVGGMLGLGFAVWVACTFGKAIVRGIFVVGILAAVGFVGLVAANWDIVDSLIAGAF